MLLLVLACIINKNKARDGPIPRAKIKVPSPAVPPKNHPIVTTVTSRQVLIQAIG